MHDPNTQAFKIGQFIEIWHVDPCIGGDDDSAGWSTPKLTAEDKKKIDEVVKWNTDKKLWEKSNFEAIAWTWGRCVYAKYGVNRPLDLAELEYCLNLASNPIDNLDHVITSVRGGAGHYLPEFLVGCVYKAMLRHHRKWWQHPKWNVSRWRVEFFWPFKFSFGRSIGDVDCDW